MAGRRRPRAAAAAIARATSRRRAGRARAFVSAAACLISARARMNAPREPLAGDREVQDGALGRGAVQRVGRDLHLAHRVALDPGRRRSARSSCADCSAPGSTGSCRRGQAIGRVQGGGARPPRSRPTGTAPPTPRSIGGGEHEGVLRAEAAQEAEAVAQFTARARPRAGGRDGCRRARTRRPRRPDSTRHRERGERPVGRLDDEVVLEARSAAWRSSERRTSRRSSATARRPPDGPRPGPGGPRAGAVAEAIAVGQDRAARARRRGGETIACTRPRRRASSRVRPGAR